MALLLVEVETNSEKQTSHLVTTVSYLEYACCGFDDGEGDGVGLQGQSVKNWLVDLLGDKGEELPPIPEAPTAVTPQGGLLLISTNQGVEDGAGGGGGLGFWSPFRLQGVNNRLGHHNGVEIVHCARVVPCEVSFLQGLLAIRHQTWKGVVAVIFFSLNNPQNNLVQGLGFGAHTFVVRVSVAIRVNVAHGAPEMPPLLVADLFPRKVVVTLARHGMDPKCFRRPT